MDAKTRYRRRRALQAALTRVMELLAGNAVAGIPADRTTALIASQVIQRLRAFAKAAGLTSAECNPAKPDLSRFAARIEARRNQTRATYRSRIKKRRKKSAGPPREVRKSRS